MPVGTYGLGLTPDEDAVQKLLHAALEVAGKKVPAKVLVYDIATGENGSIQGLSSFPLQRIDWGR